MILRCLILQVARKDSNRRRKYIPKISNKTSKDTPSQIEGLLLRISFFPFLRNVLASEWGQHYPPVAPHADTLAPIF